MAEPFSWSGLLAPDSPFMEQAGDLGWGLLAGSGPLPGNTPGGGGFAARLGRAGIYANERAGERELMKQRRAETAATIAETKGLAEMQTWMAENPGADDEAIMAAYTKHMPGQALKARMANYMTPAEKTQHQLNQAQLLKLTTELEAGRGEAVSEPFAALENIDTIAEASARLDEAGSIFQPGGVIEKAGGLDLAAAGLTTAEAAGWGGEGTKKLVNQVKDAQVVSKATAALANNLQAAGAGGTGRSAYALRNINTALGANMIWPAKREVLVTNLEVLFLDAEAQGLDKKIPDYQKYKDLHARLKTQQDAYNKRNAEKPEKTAAAGPPGGYGDDAAVATVPPGVSATPAPGATPDLGGGGGYMPEWATRGAGSVTEGALDLYNRGAAAAPGAVAATGAAVQQGVDAATGAATGAYNQAAPVVAGAVRQGVEAARPVVRQGAAAVTKAGKDALATAVKVPAEAMKIVKRVGKLGLNAAGVPVYQRWDDAARAVANGELTHASTPTGYVIIGGKIVDIRP